MDLVQRVGFNQSLDINFVVYSYMYANHCVLSLSQLLDYQFQYQNKSVMTCQWFLGSVELM